MTPALADSYAYCQRLARREATNFYFSFIVLPRHKRRAMCALYAFLRHTDDLGDNGQPADQRRAAVDAWQAALRAALAGEYPHPILPAVADCVARFAIPPEYLLAVLDGVRMDINGRTYTTFAELSDYAYHVAGVVGLACIHIWGFRGQGAFEPARQCGLAFQLTNILRDLKEDAAAGRVYLPAEDLERFGYSRDELAASVHDGRLRALVRFEIARARGLYDQGAALADWLSRDGRAVFRAMWGTYRALLEEIGRRDGDVFTRRVQLSTWRKAGIAAKSLWNPPRLGWGLP